MKKSTRDHNLVGTQVEREDGFSKVTGRARFADDYNQSGQLYGVMLRLPVAHARIRNVDFSALEGDDTIMTVCDHRDVPGHKMIGLIRRDQPVFCKEKIITPGDVIAMLVGKSESALRGRLKKIHVEYDPLPVLTDPCRALDADAPLIHPQLKNNLIIHHPLRKGNIRTGFQKSDHILEQTYTTQTVEHAYIEPECVLACLVEHSRSVYITGSIQNPFSTRRLVAEALGWPLNRVRINQAHLGGSFGGKDDIMNILSARAAIGALKTGRPVKIRYRREESIMESYKRHPYILNYKVGYMSDGKIIAMKIDILADGGAYASMSPFVTWRSVVQATGPYEIENVWTDVRAVYTNNPYTGAMRGFGSPQPIFAQESIMDEIAIRLNKSPVEIRRINGLQKGSITATGHKLERHDVNLQKVLRIAARETDFIRRWRQNRKKKPIQKSTDSSAEFILNQDQLDRDRIRPRQGIGLAVSFRGCSLGAEGIDAAAAYLSVQNDGSVYLLSGLAENGQGMRTTFSIIAAEVLGIDMQNICYLPMDTGFIADSGPTVASRSTLMGGGAVKNAAEILRRRLTGVLRHEWQIPNEKDILFSANEVGLRGSSQRISFSELCNLAYQKGTQLSTIGWYKGPQVHWEEKKGQGEAYFTYVYGCQVAEVTVNPISGEVYIDRIIAVHDPGTVINLLGAQGQVYGGVTQGAGFALWEEISVNKGVIREINFDQLIIPTSKDIGTIVPIFVQGRDRFGPWGAKSLGEPTLELTAAAVANAICNAMGKRYFNLPLNLEEIVVGRKLYPEDHRGSE